MSGGLDAMNLVRPNRFEIDLKAIARCVQNVRKTIGPSIHFFATLKANAYGYRCTILLTLVNQTGARRWFTHVRGRNLQDESTSVVCKNHPPT